MEQLRTYQHHLRKIMGPALSLCLLSYLVFLLVHGGRGYFALQGLNEKNAEVQTAYQKVLDERMMIERRVSLLRPETLDTDMLEQQAQYLLGFYSDESFLMPISTLKK